jgi:hypothetical protein
MSDNPTKMSGSTVCPQRLKRRFQSTVAGISNSMWCSGRPRRGYREGRPTGAAVARPRWASPGARPSPGRACKRGGGAPSQRGPTVAAEPEGKHGPKGDTKSSVVINDETKFSCRLHLSPIARFANGRFQRADFASVSKPSAGRAQRDLCREECGSHRAKRAVGLLLGPRGAGGSPYCAGVLSGFPFWAG